MQDQEEGNQEWKETGLVIINEDLKRELASGQTQLIYYTGSLY
jgi:hypothetical protein